MKAESLRGPADTTLELPAELFRQLLDAAPDAMVIADERGNIVLVNAQVEAVFGWPRGELIGQPIERLIPERLGKAHAAHRAAYAAAPRRRNMGVGLPLRGRRRDGSEFPVDVSLSPLTFNQHDLVIVAVRDISDRLRAESALQASQGDYKALVEALDGIVWEADPETFTFSFVSEQAERLLGYPREAWYRSPGAWQEHLHPEDREAAVNFCRAETRAGRDHVFEYRMIAADGRVVWMQDRVTVFLEGGVPRRLRGVMVDVTERRRAEEALREGRRRLAEAQEIAHFGNWEWNITDNTVRWSDELYRIYGLAPEQFPATYEGYMSRLHPDDRARVHDAIQRAYRSRAPFEFQERVVRPSGEVRWLHSYGRVFCDARDQPVRMTGTCQDITERKQAEQSFSELLEAAPDAMVMVDTRGEITLVNSQTERLFGWDRADLLGKPVEVLIPDRFHARHEAHRGGYFASPRARAMGSGLELFGLRSDRSEFPIEVSLSPVTTGAGVVAMAAIRDISERKRSEEARALLAAIVESSDDAIITKTLDGAITSWNRGAERLFGYAAQEMIGQPILRLVPPEQAAEETAIIERLRQGETLSLYESRRMAKDGRVLDVSLRISPLRDARGTVIGGSTIARDITARKQAERELARRAEALTRSNEELEQFAYVASHDLQEPLRTVASYTQLLERRQARLGDGSLSEYARYITAGVRQMQGLIEDLLAYSRVTRSEGRPTVADLNEVLKGVLANLAGTLAESGGEVTFDRLPAVLGHPGQLSQLLQNLVANALKYRGDSAPRVHVGCRREAGGWQLWVSDNGIGIDPAHFEKIFVIFQRLHSRDRYTGTGIGLALCRKIVNLHGGRIWVESVGPGQGSTFRFTLPERPPEA